MFEYVTVSPGTGAATARSSARAEHDVRKPSDCHLQSRSASPFFTRFYLALPIPLPAQLPGAAGECSPLAKTFRVRSSLL